MEPDKFVVVIHNPFNQRSAETFKNTSAYSILDFQIGDIIKVTNKINDDWAFGRLFNSTDSALFPLRFTRPLKIKDALEIATLNLSNIWWERTKQTYATGSTEKDFDNKLDLISKLTSTLRHQKESDSPKNLPNIVETECDSSFGFGLNLIDKIGQTRCLQNIEFSELLQTVKQKRLKLIGNQTIGNGLRTLETTSTSTDNEQVCVLIIQLNFEFARQVSQIDSELVISFIRDDDTRLPCFESHRIADLLTPEPIYILLKDFESKKSKHLQIKLDTFMSKLQTLPGFFVDEAQHEMNCYKSTSYTPFLVSGSANSFEKSIELTLQTNGDAALSGKMHVHGEILVHKNKEDLETELKQRQINTYQALLPLNAKPSFLAESGKDCVHLTFDFANFSLPDLQFDRLQLIIHALDLDGQIIKDVFVNSTLCNVSGLPIEKNLTSKSYLQYYLFSLKDQLKLHLEVNLPQHVCKYVQLRLLFYSATSDGRPIGNMPIALAFMRLLNNNALIGIGSAEIIIYKVDSTAMITEQKYLRASATKKKLRSHASENEMIALTTIPLYIATLSSNFTPDQNVLALLKCKEKVVVQDAMQKLASISSDFSLFVPRILLKLFDKLSMQDNELNRAIFGFINVLFKRSEYPMEYNLKKVVDSELVSLNNPRVYEPFFNLLNSSIVPDNLSDDVKTVFWMDTVRGSPKMAKIIIMSASSDPQLINYKQGNSINNFVSQHLNTKFTLLLNNIISTLRSKNTQLADHQWMICKNLPDMIDVLFQHEIFDAHALALFLIELVQIVPAKYQNSQIELIRAVTKTQLYKDENVRRSTLMPAIMPFIVQSLDVASTRPIESSKLLHSTVALLLNILHLIRSPLHQIGDKSTRKELLFVTTNCLLPIIRCFNASIYNGHGELELLSQTVFVTLIDLIDAQMFSAYLETFEDEHSISDMLAEFLKSLRAFTEPTSIQEFNEQPVKLVLQQQCVKYFQVIKCVIFDNRTFSDFQITVCKELSHVIYSFLMSSNENRLNLYFEQINSLRLASVECFRSMWFSLSANKKLALGRNTFEFVLDLLSSVQSQRLNSILLAMFGDILKTEGYHYIELTKQNSDRCFTVYKLLHNKLMKRPTSLKSRNTLCTELEKELHSFVLCDQKFSCVKKLNMLPTFLKLINYGREALFRNNPFEIGLIYYKFLEFWYEIGEKELILEYILRLYTFHKNQDELVEAALSLQNYALRLSWTNNEDAPELRPLTKSLKLEVKSERQIKEHLYWHVSELFGMASAWELAIPILKELATHYETVNLDYEQLGNVMEKLKECYHLIGKRLRLNCLYFVVSFYGSQQPDYLRNKRFIFCGKPVEMLDSFRQRIVLNFGCELRHSLDEDPEKLFALDGRHATVASVQPVPGNQYLRLSVAENPLVAWYYKHNVMNKFLMTRPLNKKKSEWTEKFGVTDTTKVWIKCTEFNLNQTLPGILSFREVFLERELETLNPLQAACLTLTNTNEELSINARLVSQGFGDTYLNALLGQLRGILQAFVGGGIANYEMFLSDQVDSLLVEKEMLGEKERLKNLLVEQVKLLDYGLYVNAEHLNEATKLLHDTLVDSFNEYKQKIQKLCGVEFIASLSRKASMSELDSHRRNTKYLSRLSTDGTSFTGDLKPALQQRSMSITCPADSSIHQKPSVLKRKLIKSDLPLPSRRSNRHSTKLLNP